MEEEDQEQKLPRKFYNKVFFGGKAMEGHVRGHLHSIAVAKSQEPIPDSETKIAQRNWVSCTKNHQENVAKMDVVVGSCSENWGLKRENFPGRATEDAEIYLCQKCGKGFSSKKAVYGHMQIHSKKSSRVPRTKSETRFNNASNPQFSTSNEPISVPSEFDDDLIEAAKTLMMLSMGVRTWNEVLETKSISRNDGKSSNLYETCGFGSGKIVKNDDEKRPKSGVFYVGFLIDQFKKLEISDSSSKNAGIAYSEMKQKIPETKPVSNSSCKKSKVAESENKTNVFASCQTLRIHCNTFIKSKGKEANLPEIPDLNLLPTNDVDAMEKPDPIPDSIHGSFEV